MGREIRRGSGVRPMASATRAARFAACRAPRRAGRFRHMPKFMVRFRSRVLVVIGALALLAPAMPVSAVSTDTRIDFGGNKHVFGQNWEDEPSVALDPAHPNILAAGV